MDHRTIRQIAGAQHGLISHRQVISAGGTDRSIEWMIHSGRWDAVRPSVYLVGVGGERSWPQPAMAAVLAAGTDAYAGFRTAARLHGLVDRTGRLELLTDGYRRVRLPGVLTHRTIHLGPEDVTMVAGVPTTSVNRTLIDLGARQSEATLGRWIDQCLLGGQTDVASLARRTSELNLRGRPRPVSLMRALALRADGHDPGRSALEARVIAAAAAHGLPRLIRQHPVDRPDGRRAFIDLARPESMLAIELDGWASHGVRSAFESDRIRANELLLLGWNLLRFTWRMHDTYICETIEAVIARHEHS